MTQLVDQPMQKEFVEEPLASPGSAKYLICNFVETQGLFKKSGKTTIQKVKADLSQSWT